MTAGRPVDGRRLLFISPAYPPPMVGGSFVYFHTVLENAEHEFDILCAAGPGGLAELSKHEVIRSR